MPLRVALGIEGTLAGRAYRTGQVQAADGAAGTRRLWLPLSEGSERLGVLEVAAPVGHGPGRRASSSTSRTWSARCW